MPPSESLRAINASLVGLAVTFSDKQTTGESLPLCIGIGKNFKFVLLVDFDELEFLNMYKAYFQILLCSSMQVVLLLGYCVVFNP